MLANAGAGRDSPATFVLDESSRSAAAALGSRWKKTVARVHILEAGMGELARLVSAADGDSVILAALSSVSVVDAEELLERASSTGDRVVKFSVGKTPVEIFAARRATAAKILESAAERAPAGGSLRELLFEGALHAAIDVLQDVPGELLFQNNLMDYYESNMWLAANAGSVRFHATVARLPVLNDRGAESRIAEKGSVDRSWIASGVEVHGTVEDSVIFPNVVVGRNARVSRSLVLNGNRIGAGAELQGALVFPCTVDAPRPALSIGDNCSVGARTSTMKNADYPVQIRDGLAVIGSDAELPGGFRAEGASYVAPGTPASVLRRLKVLRKGTSVHPSAGGDGRGTRRREAR
jgi:hypothetical protein